MKNKKFEIFSIEHVIDSNFKIIKTDRKRVRCEIRYCGKNETTKSESD